MRRSHLNNGFGKSAPGRLSFTAIMVKAIGNIFGSLCAEEGDVAARPRDIARSGRAAVLIVDNGQAVPLAGQAQDRLDEIVPVRAVDPRSAQDRVARVRGGDGVLAGKLALPINIERRCGVGLDIGRALAAIEHIVGRDVDQRNTAPRGFAGEYPGRVRIDGEGKIPLALGPIHICISGSVDDGVPGARGDCIRDGIGPGQIELVGVGRNHNDISWAIEREKLAAHLAGASEKKQANRHTLFFAPFARPRRCVASSACSSGSHQARLAMYHCTVRARPDSKEFLGAQHSSAFILDESMAYRKSWPGRSGTKVTSSRYDWPLLRGARRSIASQVVCTTSMLRRSAPPPML